VTDPKADGQPYTGTWTVDSVDPVLDEGGNLAGSATIIQVLKKNVYDYCTPDNFEIVRTRAYPLEQNENAWMYYERFKKEETTKWYNISASSLDDLFDNMRQIWTYNSQAARKIEEDDSYFDPTYHVAYYYDRKHLYDIVVGDGSSSRQPVIGEYYIAPTAVYEANAPVHGSVVSWWIPYAAVWTSLGNVIIRECWTEKNTDGTYNLYRSLETTSTTSIMRTRALQYAGMTLVQGAPMEDDTVLTIAGLNNLTEIVYKDARFRIGSDTYRVLANSTAVAGTVTVDVTPAVTADTETACYDNPNQVQCFFEAL
jgi:hypothetical protein